MLNPGHTLGQISELTLVNPITAGEVETLRGVLHDLNRQRIFTAVGAIHFARLVIVTPPGGVIERDSYLLFVCCYDGDFALLVAALSDHLAAPLDAVWRHTRGWTAAQPVATFQAWVLAHVARANMAYTPYPLTTVPEIKRSLAIDNAVQDFFDVIRTVPEAQALLAALAK